MASFQPSNETGSLANLLELRAQRDRKILEAYQSDPSTQHAQKLADEAGITLRQVYRIIERDKPPTGPDDAITTTEAKSA